MAGSRANARRGAVLTIALAQLRRVDEELSTVVALLGEERGWAPEVPDEDEDLKRQWRERIQRVRDLHDELRRERDL